MAVIINVGSRKDDPKNKLKGLAHCTAEGKMSQVNANGAHFCEELTISISSH